MNENDVVINNLMDVYNRNLLPRDHVNFLYYLKQKMNFTPNVCYDIGACVLHWTRHAKNAWQNSKVYVFDAFDLVEPLYKLNNLDYHIGVLSHTDNMEVKFYQNNILFGGNSYYREIGSSGDVFKEDCYLIKKTYSLDTVVENKNFLLPDLIKMDVQGAELDVIKGANKCLEHATVLIAELQDVDYNLGAPKKDHVIEYLKTIGWKCIAEKFSDNGPDGDYCFINTNKIN